MRASRSLERCGWFGLAAAGLGATPRAVPGDRRVPRGGGRAPAEGRPVLITPFAGAGVQIEYLGAVIHVDPWSRGDYARAKRADLILITDVPADQLDSELIRSLRTPSTVVVVPTTQKEARDAEGVERLRAVDGAPVMRNAESIELAFPRATPRRWASRR